MIWFILLLQLYHICGVTQKFRLELNREILPGFTKKQVTINGTTPGPTLNITLGNWAEVKFILTDNEQT